MTIESAGTSAHQGLVSRSVQAGRGRGAGSATSAACTSPSSEIESQNGDFSYSHSMVAGGFEEMSRATRFTSVISLMIRLETRSSRS